MTVDTPLLVEGLLADVAHLGIREVLVLLELQTRHILDVGH